MSDERTEARLLAEATETLRGHEVEIAAGAQARVGAALAARRSPRWTPRPLWIAAGAMAVAAMAWLMMPSAQRQRAPVRSISAPARPIVAKWSPGKTKLAPSTRISIGKTTLTARQPSVVRIPDGQQERINLTAGALDVEVVAGNRLTIITPHTRLQSAGAVLHVAVRVAGTAVSVSKGEVQVISLNLTTRPSTLVAGERTFVSTAPPREATTRLNSKQAPRARFTTRRTAALPNAQKAAPTPARSFTAVNAPADEPGLEPASPMARPHTTVPLKSQPVDAPAAPPPSTKPPAPTPRKLVLSLLRRADRLRRGGRFREAADLYLAVADHPAGKPYVEESLLRRAILLAKQLRDSSGALQTLAAARRRLPTTSALSPERVALTAQLMLDNHAAEKAAAVLLSCTSRSRALLRLRLQVARTLWRSNHPQAKLLLEPLLEASSPETLRRAASRLRLQKVTSSKKN